MKNFLPLIKGYSSSTYTKAFILGSILVTFTAVFAIHYNELSTERLILSQNCKNKHQPIFCHIKKSNMLRKLEIIIQTFCSTLIIYFILFFIFGYGGGSLNEYYKPNTNDLKDFILIICFIILLNILFYYIVIIKIRKRIPPLYGVLYGIGVQYGIINQIEGPFKMVNNHIMSKNDRHNILNPDIKIPYYNYI